MTTRYHMKKKHISKKFKKSAELLTNKSGNYFFNLENLNLVTKIMVQKKAPLLKKKMN